MANESWMIEITDWFKNNNVEFGTTLYMVVDCDHRFTTTKVVFQGMKDCVFTDEEGNRSTEKTLKFDIDKSNIYAEDFECPSFHIVNVSIDKSHLIICGWGDGDEGHSYCANVFFADYSHA